MLADRVRMGSSGKKLIQWKTVQDIVRAGEASNYFDIGDELVSLYDGREIIWQVIGRGLDIPSDSNYTHSMTIQTKDCLEDRQWHSTDNNIYINSSIRIYLNNSFLNKLDPELSAVIGQVNKKVARPNGQNSFSDKVFLLSRREVDLGDEGIITGEFIYPFYNGKGDTNRIKDGSDVGWWLRSPVVESSSDVRRVFTNGRAYSYAANSTCGVSPACVII